MDKRQIHGFTQLIQAMYAAFGRQFDKSAVVGWMLGLDGLSEQQIRSGVAVATQVCDALPTPRRVRELATQGQADAGNAAWSAAVKAVSAVGYMRSVCFRDGAVNATILEMGGWPAFCGLFEREAEVWVRKRFIEVFERMCADGRTAGVLAGASEVQRTPRVIGMRAPGDRDTRRLGLLESNVPPVEQQVGVRLKRAPRPMHQPMSVRPVKTEKGAAEIIRERWKTEATPAELERRKASVLQQLERLSHVGEL